MTNIRLFAVIAVSVVSTALVMGAITRPAHADTPRTAECQWQFAGQMPAKQSESIAAWINGQLAAGRTSIAVVPGLVGAATAVCAW